MRALLSIWMYIWVAAGTKGLSSSSAGLCSGPLVVEDGGRLGQHALALLRELAERGVGLVGEGKPAAGKLRTPRPAQMVGYWIRRWMAHLSAFTHITLSSVLLEAVRS